MPCSYVYIRINFALINFLKSVAIGESAYESEWIDKSIAYKKGLVSMIQRSHRIISLSAFKFGELSKELFTEVRLLIHRFKSKPISFESYFHFPPDFEIVLQITYFAE